MCSRSSGTSKTLAAMTDGMSARLAGGLTPLPSVLESMSRVWTGEWYESGVWLRGLGSASRIFWRCCARPAMAWQRESIGCKLVDILVVAVVMVVMRR